MKILGIVLMLLIEAVLVICVISIFRRTVSRLIHGGLDYIGKIMAPVVRPLMPLISALQSTSAYQYCCRVIISSTSYIRGRSISACRVLAPIITAAARTLISMLKFAYRAHIASGRACPDIIWGFVLLFGFAFGAMGSAAFGVSSLSGQFFYGIFAGFFGGLLIFCPAVGALIIGMRAIFIKLHSILTIKIW